MQPRRPTRSSAAHCHDNCHQSSHSHLTCASNFSTPNLDPTIKPSQAGCSLTVGSTVMSVFVAAKMGLFGYAMLLFVVAKTGFTLSWHAIAFAVLLAISADIFTMLGLARKAPPAARGAAGAQARGDKPAKRKAPRDTVSASNAKAD